MLASHFHDTITVQALTAALLILLGIAVAVWGASRVPRLERRVQVSAAVVALLVAGAGIYRLAEVPALRHNHLCHAHNSDDSLCSYTHSLNRDNHTHWFGGRASEPRSR